MNFDVFNGDADGICALLQLRLQTPEDNVLITGVKRDISLVKQVPEVSDCTINVLDVAFEKNYADVLRLLEHNQVFYCDHHKPGPVPCHPHLTTLINPHAEVCTSLLINGHLAGAYALWAVVGAFGDNLDDSAKALAKTCTISAKQLAALKQLGQLINYNAYGRDLDDLHFLPANLYRQLLAYANPLDFIQTEKTLFNTLEAAYAEDLQRAKALRPWAANAKIAVFIMPDEKWARRVNGTFANQMVYQNPARAHAILTQSQGAYNVSVRAPLLNKQGAATVCSAFATGGGREAAAGIQCLPVAELAAFIKVFEDYYV